MALHSKHHPAQPNAQTMNVEDTQEVTRHDERWSPSLRSNLAVESNAKIPKGSVYRPSLDEERLFSMLGRPAEGEWTAAGQDVMPKDYYRTVGRSISSNSVVVGQGVEFGVRYGMQPPALGTTNLVQHDLRREINHEVRWTVRDTVVQDASGRAETYGGYQNTECGFCERIGHATEECFYNPLGNNYKPECFPPEEEENLRERGKSGKPQPPAGRRKRKASAKKKKNRSLSKGKSGSGSSLYRRSDARAQRAAKEGIDLGTCPERMRFSRRHTPTYSFGRRN